MELVHSTLKSVLTELAAVSSEPLPRKESDAEVGGIQMAKDIEHDEFLSQRAMQV